MLAYLGGGELKEIVVKLSLPLLDLILVSDLINLCKIIFFFLGGGEGGNQSFTR